MMSPSKMLPGQQLQKQGAAPALAQDRSTGSDGMPGPEKEDLWDARPAPANSTEVLGEVPGQRESAWSV